MLHLRGRKIAKNGFSNLFSSQYSITPLQPFSQEPRTATVPKVFQIGLCGVVEADLELFWDSWSAGFLGERLYML